MIRLLRSLEKNNSITCLRLENFSISNEVCRALSNLIEVNESIAHISLFNCDLSTSGLSLLSKGVKLNETLRLIKIVGSSDVQSEDLEIFEAGNNNRRSTALLIRLNELSIFLHWKNNSGI